MGLVELYLCSALKRDMALNGKRSKKGIANDALNSLRRLFIGAFRDKNRQLGIDRLLASSPD
jgi:hypothetical protein